MMKKIFIYSILVLFSTNVAAEELFMKCEKNSYKYVVDPAGDKVFWKHPKGTKNKYQEWCIDRPVGAQVSKEGVTRIVKNKKATCMVKKTVYPENNIITNSVSVNDYVNLTRYIEWYHSKSGDKKNVKDIKCKKRKQ